ncbi:MAG TPA: hypothetical protein ENK18_23275, partial [Deltaproteobacteria bacterium]|nr:hypothetical protein [Deltaproteobacteria bacterium]
MEHRSPVDTGLPEGWKPRSEPVEAPGGTLFRVRGPRGEIGIALQFREDLIDHPMLQRGMDDVADFVLAPEVPGVLPLVAWNRERALFIYKIDDGQLLSEVLARCVEHGVIPGERVAIELLGRAALALDDAARAGARVGVDNHGCLTPWRIVVYPGGEVSLLGYALPPIEVFAWLDEETDEPPGPGLRYTPPERIQDSLEDLRTDIYTLGMIAAEVALGTPLLKGTPRQLVDQILEGEPAAALGEFSEAGQGLLETVLHPAKAARPSTGAEVANLAKKVLPNLRGHTLGGLARGAFHEDAVLLDEGMAYPALLYVESGDIEVIDYDEDTDELERPTPTIVPGDRSAPTIAPEPEPEPEPQVPPGAEPEPQVPPGAEPEPQVPPGAEPEPQVPP